MIEIVSQDRCIGCDKCVHACPTNVFDRGADGIPVIARQSDCQTCFMCEAYCPVDALFVAPTTDPLPPDSRLLNEPELAASGLLGSYRERLGWGRGRTPGARFAMGPDLPGTGSPGPTASPVATSTPGPTTPPTASPPGSPEHRKAPPHA